MTQSDFLDALLNNAGFSSDKLLLEMVTALGHHELEAMFEHIATCYDLDNDGNLIT